MPNQAQANSRPVWLWALVQIGIFFKLLSQILLVGVVMAVVPRRFHWRSFFVGTLATGAGVVRGWRSGGRNL